MLCGLVSPKPWGVGVTAFCGVVFESLPDSNAEGRGGASVAGGEASGGFDHGYEFFVVEYGP